jgi:FMN phosphatase YigB (HAD superfamily)
MLKIVLFDMGDTLLLRNHPNLPTRLRHQNDALHTLLCHSYPDIPLPASDEFHARLSAVLQQYRNSAVTSEMVLEHLCREHGWPIDPADEALLTAWHAPILDDAVVEPDIKDTLAALQALGLRLGIISNTNWRSPWRDRELAHQGILDYFPVRIYSSDLRVEKPDARIFAAALAAMGDPAPDEALYVGNSLEDDVAGGHGAGLWTAWLAPAGVTTAPVDAPVAPDIVLTALRELPAKLAAQFDLPRHATRAVGG